MFGSMEEIQRRSHQSQQNRMTKEEVHRYLSDMELKEEQFDAVYQYLVTNGITITGFHPSRTEGPCFLPPRQCTPASPEVSTETDGSQLQENADAPRRISKAERNLELYRREVSALTAHSGAELSALWDCFLSGDTSAKDALVHEQLDKVFRIAKTYEKRRALHWMK